MAFAEAVRRSLRALISALEDNDRTLRFGVARSLGNTPGKVVRALKSPGNISRTIV